MTCSFNCTFALHLLSCEVNLQDSLCVICYILLDLGICRDSGEQLYFCTALDIIMIFVHMLHGFLQCVLTLT